MDGSTNIILFLDIDGVVNCASTQQRHRGYIGIDPYMAFLVGKIVLDTGCKVVLSSTWRCFHDDGIEEISKQVTPIQDATPKPWYNKETERHSTRGEEIQAWLDQHPEVERYAILDDDTQILESQEPNWFRTFWLTGITPEIAEQVTKHLNGSISGKDEQVPEVRNRV